jgi:hypothetical protein
MWMSKSSFVSWLKEKVIQRNVLTCTFVRVKNRQLRHRWPVTTMWESCDRSTMIPGKFSTHVKAAQLSSSYDWPHDPSSIHRHSIGDPYLKLEA